MSLHNLSREQVENCSGFVKGVTEDAILLRCLNNYYLWCLKDDVSLTPNIMHHGFWESWITSWFTRNINEGDYVLDIGANCGYFTMLFDRLVGSGYVSAYEANPKYVDLLQKTMEFNDADFEINPVAVSNMVGSAKLTFPGEYTGSASLVADFDAKYGDQHDLNVLTTTLDFEFKNSDRLPNLVKMDVEGAEEMVWDGGSSLWNANEAPVIVMEYTPGAYTKEFYNKLSDWGIVTGIGYNGEEHPVDEDFLKSLTDWYMLVVRRG